MKYTRSYTYDTHTWVATLLSCAVRLSNAAQMKRRDLKQKARVRFGKKARKRAWIFTS